MGPRWRLQARFGVPKRLQQCSQKVAQKLRFPEHGDTAIRQLFTTLQPCRPPPKSINFRACWPPEIDEKQIDDIFSTDELGMLTTVMGNNENCKCPCEAVKRLKMEK